MSAVAFLISLDDKISPGAKSAAGSLAELDASLKKDQASVRTMESALKRLQSTEGASQERIDALSAAIENKKAKIGETTNAIADFKGGTEQAGGAADFFKNKLAAMGGPAGIAIAVLTAVAAALVAVGAALVKTALASASAYRNQVLLNTAMSGSVKTGQAMTEATYRVARTVALSSEGVEKLAGSLSKAGLSGSTFEKSLKNLANVASVAGEDAVGPIKEIIEKSQQLGHLKMEGDQLKGTGLQAKQVFEILSKDLGIGVKDVEQRLKDGKITAEQGIGALNKAMESKFGALAGKKLLDFDTQVAKAKENFAGMFRGVNIEGFLTGLSKVLGMLDETTTTGAAIKKVLTGAVQGFFNAATVALPYVKEFLLQIAIAGLRTYLALRPIVRAMAEALGFDGEGGGKEALETMAAAGRTVGYILAGTVIAAITAVAVVGALLYGTYQLVAGAFIEVGSAVWSVASAIQGGFNAAVEFLAGLDFGQIASDLIDGLVSGIENGTGLVISAIGGLGSSAIGALKSTLGIASPSKVFAGLGGFTAEGFAGGIDKGAASVEASVGAMVAIPSVAAPTAAPASPAAQGGGAPVIIEAGAIVVQVDGTGKNAKEVGDEVEGRMGLALAKLAEMLGMPVEAPAQ